MRRSKRSVSEDHLGKDEVRKAAVLNLKAIKEVGTDLGNDLGNQPLKLKYLFLFLLTTNEILYDFS